MRNRARARLGLVVALAVLAAGWAGEAAPLTCVGDPPRQAADPLSPPCVPFWSGDNLGDTWFGVTGREIRVVLYNDLGVSGDFSRPRTVRGDPVLVRTIAAQLHYFASRFQTYDRAVHLVALPSDGPSSGAATRRRDAEIALRRIDPFAAVFLGEGGEEFFRSLALGKRMSIGVYDHLPRAFLDDQDPYVWSFMPDRETTAGLSASFVCRKLYADADGRPGQGIAHFARDPALLGRPRTFALVRPVEGLDDPLAASASALVTGLNRECPRPGKPDWFDDVVRYEAQAGLGAQAVAMAARLKLENITTVVCYCLPGVTAEAFQAASSALAYSPEWYWDEATRTYGFERPAGLVTAQHANLGTTARWRGPALEQQYAYQAYQSERPGTEPDPEWNARVYHSFLALFYAFQAGGPSLDPGAAGRGLYTWNYLNRGNPFVPLGGMGPYNDTAMGDHTFIDTAMGWWWDPFGTPPGGTSGEGCVRVAQQGLRFYAGEWSFGDRDLFVPTAPCTEEVLP